MIEKKTQKDDLMWKKENDNIRTLLGQLGWITGQTDLVFDVCQLSSILHRSKVDDVLKGNKLLLQAKNTLLRYGLSGPIGNFKIFCYNDSSLGNLKNGGSQGGFIIYLIGDVSID